MAYYRILMKQTDTFEILVSAGDMASAIEKARTIEWGEPIDTDIYEYMTNELEIKNVG